MAQNYFQALDEQDYEAAYRFMSPSLREHLSFEQFTAERQNTDAKFGKPKTRLVKNVSWYPGATNSGTGIAAAIDFYGVFKSEHKFCGYIALVEIEPAKFALMRNDTTFVDPNLVKQLTKAQQIEFLNRPGCKHFLEE